MFGHINIMNALFEICLAVLSGPELCPLDPGSPLGRLNDSMILLDEVG